MKAIRYFITITSTIIFCSSISATVVTKKSGKSLIVEFHTKSLSEVSIEYIETDFRKAMAEANNQNSSTVLFKDNVGNFYKIVKGKDKISQVDQCCNELKNEIAKMAVHSSVQGEKIKTERVKLRNPQYRSETYINGRLDSTYETDWTTGYFPPETSSYKTGNRTYVIKTYYVPEQYGMKDVFAPSYTITTQGIQIFINKVYIKD